MRNPRVWLCLPPLLLLGLDAALTLTGQPAEYWSVDYAHVKELNPAAWLLLRWHPALFVLGILGVGLLIAGLLLRLPARHAFVVALVSAFLSAIGACSWLIRLGLPGWGLAILLLWSAERLVSWSWREAGKAEATG